MDGKLDLMAQKMEQLESTLKEYQDNNIRWQQAQEERNWLRNTSIAHIRDTLDGVEASLNARQRKTLSVPEAARSAKVKNATVRRWLADGRLKGAKVGDNKQSHWRIRRQDLDAFLERVTNSPG